MPEGLGRVGEWGKCKRHGLSMDFRTVGTEKAERCTGASSSRKAVHVNLGTWHLTLQSLGEDATEGGAVIRFAF